MSALAKIAQTDSGEAIHFDSKEVHALRVALAGNPAASIALERAQKKLDLAASRGTGTAAKTGERSS